jgi:hypothetical protein
MINTRLVAELVLRARRRALIMLDPQRHPVKHNLPRLTLFSCMAFCPAVPSPTRTPSQLKLTAPDARPVRAARTGVKVWDLRTGLELPELTADLVRDRPAANRPAFAYNGDVVYALFASEDGIDSYAFDGTPRP